MKAEFIGTEGSEGLEKGKIYEVEIIDIVDIVYNHHLFLKINMTTHNKVKILRCQYKTEEILLANWDFK